MKELSFDTGVVEYQVNGGAVLRFNPADTHFVRRLHDLFEELGQEQQAEGGVFDTLEKKDAAMRERLDGLFGPGTCQAVFGTLGLYALAGGLPLWANFLLAVLEEVESAVDAQQQAASPRVAYYMERFAARR